MKKLHCLRVSFYLAFMGLFLVGCEAKLPEFAGIYVLQDGKYIEVKRIKDLREEEFNHQKRSGFMSSTDCNVKIVISREKFIPIDQETFNQKGFLVVQYKEWSDFKLYRVPTDEYLKDNEKGNDIVTNVAYGCGRVFSSKGLYSKKEPKEIEIKQAKKGENAFLYVPSSPVEKGFYLIDYKLNGRSHIGWNPLVVN